MGGIAMSTDGFVADPSSGTVIVTTPTFPVLANATTADLIRDRIIAVIEALAPTSLGTRFKHFLDEDDADFIAWAMRNPTGALRRFQVDWTGDDAPPETSNTDYEERMVPFVITVAYPQSERFGKLNARDRRKVMSQDQHMIEHAIGLTGRLNFSPPTYPDAVWRSGRTSRVKGNPVDFLVIEQSMAFLRKQF